MFKKHLINIILIKYLTNNVFKKFFRQIFNCIFFNYLLIKYIIIKLTEHRLI